MKKTDCNPFPPNDCQEFADRRKSVVCSDKGSKVKYAGINKKEKLVAKFTVDNCLIKEGKRCDFLVLVCEEESAYFIETKGCEILKAAEQLNRSIGKLKEYLKDYKKINARIVLTRVQVPDLRKAEFIKLERKIKQLNGTVIKKERILEEYL